MWKSDTTEQASSAASTEETTTATLIVIEMAPNGLTMGRVLLPYTTNTSTPALKAVPSTLPAPHTWAPAADAFQVHLDFSELHFIATAAGTRLWPNLWLGPLLPPTDDRRDRMTSNPDLIEAWRDVKKKKTTPSSDAATDASGRDRLEPK